MNTQFAELIEKQKTVVADKAQKLADAQKELADANMVLEELVKSEQLCNMADAAQQKIEEGNRELEEAIAAMPPEVAAMWGDDIAEDVPTTPTAEPEVENVTPPPIEKKPEPSDKEVDKVVEFIRMGKHKTNETGLQRKSVPLLTKAAEKVGVPAAGKKKMEIAEAIAAVLQTPPVPAIIDISPPFQKGEMVQNSQGKVGDCIKKDGGGESVSDISTSEQSIPSGSPPPDSSDITTAIDIEPPVNGEVMTPDDMREAS